MSTWADLDDEAFRKAPWLSLKNLSDLNFALTNIEAMRRRGVRLLAIDDSIYLELDEVLSPLIVDEFHGEIVFSVGDLL